MKTEKLKIPKDWTFNSAAVASQFDAHVREQLPWYELATKGIGLIARHYIPENGLVYDIGASTGNIGRELAETLTARSASLIAIESSMEMATRYAGPGKLLCVDANEFIYSEYDLAICFLVFMFIPLDKRQCLFEKLMNKIRPGGALIIVDKMAFDGYLGTIMHRLTLFGKVLNKVPAAEIIAKELSLSGVQRPINPLELFAGHRYYEWFRFGEFGGWIFEK